MQITDVISAEIFEVKSDKSEITRICTSGTNAQKVVNKLFYIILFFILSLGLKHLKE